MTGRRPARWVLLCALATTLFVARASAGEGPPAAVAARPLVPLTEPKARMAAWKKHLCERDDLACAADPSKLTLYRTTGDPPGTVWGILRTGPILLEMVPGRGSELSVQRLWDFSTYTHSKGDWGQPLDEDLEPPKSLYPALYPVGPHAWAVAVVHDVAEFYAGGGAGFAIADFVVLSDGPVDEDDALVPLYTGVPFSCGKTVKTCFSEEDYRRNRHNCHDDSSGTLTLTYSPSASPDRYTWTAAWHEAGDPSRQVLTLPAKGGDVWCSAHFAFCGGPMMSDENDPCSSAYRPRTPPAPAGQPVP